ncbi:hypothetical protein O6H91_Y317300 [Diphasiastrum complanatum]|nr:hypothetical protein O6H91_Y317300 [Diphasiastrum complanatum]
MQIASSLSCFSVTPISSQDNSIRFLYLIFSTIHLLWEDGIYAGPRALRLIHLKTSEIYMGKLKDTHIQSSSRRKESKEKKLRKEERGSRKVRKLRHNSSYSVSSSGSSEDEISNKSKEEALGRKRKQEKCNGGRERSDSKRKRREKSFSSLDEESSSSESDSIAKTTELAVNALDMAVKIVKQFPEIAAELEQVFGSIQACCFNCC